MRKVKNHLDQKLQRDSLHAEECFDCRYFFSITFIKIIFQDNISVSNSLDPD